MNSPTSGDKNNYLCSLEWNQDVFSDKTKSIERKKGDKINDSIDQLACIPLECFQEIDEIICRKKENKITVIIRGNDFDMCMSYNLVKREIEIIDVLNRNSLLRTYQVINKLRSVHKDFFNKIITTGIKAGNIVSGHSYRPNIGFQESSTEKEHLIEILTSFNSNYLGSTYGIENHINDIIKKYKKGEFENNSIIQELTRTDAGKKLWRLHGNSLDFLLNLNT